MKGNVVKVDSLNDYGELQTGPSTRKNGDFSGQKTSDTAVNSSDKAGKNNPFRSCGIKRNHDEKALMAVALFSALPVPAADYSEKTQYRAW